MPRVSVALDLVLHQFSPVLADPAENLGRIAEAAASEGAGLFVTPELSVTGYAVGDDAATLGARLDLGDVPRFLGLEPEKTPKVGALVGLPGDVLLGLVEAGPDGVAYNAAACMRDGEICHRYRKIHLPTYGMFDEARFFGRGRHVQLLERPDGWRVGVLICEDFWHPSLAYLLAVAGADLVVVLAAAPGRGSWEGGRSGGRFASWDAWVDIARTTARFYGIYVAVVNRVGVEGGITFAGGSLIAAADGDVMAAAGAGPELLRGTLHRDRLARARRPYAHVRDEDPGLVLDELTRLVQARRNEA